MSEKMVKIGATGLGAIITYISGNFSPIIYILILFEIMDYVSGVVSAARKGDLSSTEAFWGFAKKLFYFFVIAIAFCFDYVVFEVGGLIGITAKWPSVFGVLSVCYLMSTEAISILENLAEMGISIKFLSGAIKAFQTKIEEKAIKSE